MVSLGSSLVNLLTIGASGEAVVANGSPYAMDRLDKVYRRILAHFKMMPDMDDVFAAKRLYVNHKTQKVAQWGVKTDEAELSTPPF